MQTRRVSPAACSIRGSCGIRIRRGSGGESSASAWNATSAPGPSFPDGPLATSPSSGRKPFESGSVKLIEPRGVKEGSLGFASLGHYTRERLGIGTRAAENRAELHRLLRREPALRRAWERDEFSESLLLHFRRLNRSGLRGSRLAPWARRARRVTTTTFRDQVRWIEAMREGSWNARNWGQSRSRTGGRRPGRSCTNPAVNRKSIHGLRRHSA